jgi:hypothetical protein
MYDYDYIMVHYLLLSFVAASLLLLLRRPKCLWPSSPKDVFHALFLKPFEIGPIQPPNLALVRTIVVSVVPIGLPVPPTVPNPEQGASESRVR